MKQKLTTILIVIVLLVQLAPLSMPVLAAPPAQEYEPGSCGQELIDNYQAEQTGEHTYIMEFTDISIVDDLDQDELYTFSYVTYSTFYWFWHPGSYLGGGDNYLRVGAEDPVTDGVAAGARFQFSDGTNECRVQEVDWAWSQSGIAGGVIGIALMNDPENDFEYIDLADSIEFESSAYGLSYETGYWDFSDPVEYPDLTVFPEASSIWLAARTNGTVDYWSGFDYVEITFSYEEEEGDSPDDYVRYIRPLNPDDELPTTVMSSQLSPLDEELFPFKNAVFDSTGYQPWAWDVLDFEANSIGVSDMNAFSIVYRSLLAGDLVHSPGPALVDSIDRIDIEESELCNDQQSVPIPDWANLLLSILSLDLVDIYNYLFNVETFELCLIDDDLYTDLWYPFDHPDVSPVSLIGGGGLISYQTWGVYPTGSIVRLQMVETQHYISYWVQDAEQYVSEGQFISGGCVIGRTMPQFAVAMEYGVEGLYPNEAALLPGGVGFIWAVVDPDVKNIPQDLHLRYWIYPSTDEPCSAPDFGACINDNPEFLDPLTPPWLFGPDSDPHGSGTTGLYLTGDGDNDTAQAVLIPNPLLDYAVRINGQVLIPNDLLTDSVVDVTLGDTTYNVTFPADGSEIEYISGLALVEDGDYSTAIADLEIAMNTGQDETGALIHITYACIDDEADSLTPLPDCVLTNYSFDEDSDWTLSTTPPAVASIKDGALTLAAEATAEQTISLLPGYYDVNLSIRARPQTPVPGSYSTEVDWSYYDGASEVGSGSCTADSTEWIECTDTLLVSTEVTDGTFTVSAPAAVDTAQVDFVCLVPNGADYDGGSQTCSSCPVYYTGDADQDFIESIRWHSCRINQLYYCDWRELVVDTRDGVNDTVRGLGMLGRWLTETVSRGNLYARSLVYYLGGHLNNVGLAVADSIAWQVGGSTTIIADQPLGFWDVLGLLITSLRDTILGALNSLVELMGMLFAFLGPIAGTLLQALEMIIAGMFNLVDQLISQLELLYYFVAEIINAFNNATPVAIEGIPDCASFETTDSWVCWGFYILDNTIFSGPQSYVLPLLIGATAISLLAWGFERIVNALAKAG